MRALSILLPVALLALIGCSSETPTNPAPDDTAISSEADAIATTFVSLKVPNMV